MVRGTLGFQNVPCHFRYWLTISLLLPAAEVDLIGYFPNDWLMKPPKTSEYGMIVDYESILLAAGTSLFATKNMLVWACLSSLSRCVLL